MTVYSGNWCPDWCPDWCHYIGCTQRAMSTFQQFAKRSSCAGIVHLGHEENSTTLRLFWIIVLVIGIGLTTTITTLSFQSILANIASSEMVVVQRQSEIQYPALHICESNLFNLTVLKGLGFDDDEMISYLRLSLAPDLVSSLLIGDQQRRRRLKSRYDAIAANRTVEEIYDLSLLKCEDMVVGCIAIHITYDRKQCCQTFFNDRTFPSMNMGSCISAKNPRKYSSYEASRGFIILVRGQQEEGQQPSVVWDNQIVSPYFVNRRGVSYSATNFWTDKKVATMLFQYFSPLAHFVSLPITKSVVNDMEAMQSVLSRHQCMQRHLEQDFAFLVPDLDHYTKDNCDYVYLHNKTVKRRNCRFQAFPSNGNLAACSPDQSIDAAVEQMQSVVNGKLSSVAPSGGCIADCIRESYSFEPSLLSLKLDGNMKIGSTWIHPNESGHLVALHFFIPSNTQQHIINHYPSLIQTLGLLGGNLGLFLGASVITILEVLVFLVTLCCPKRCTKESTRTQ